MRRIGKVIYDEQEVTTLKPSFHKYIGGVAVGELAQGLKSTGCSSIGASLNSPTPVTQLKTFCNTSTTGPNVSSGFHRQWTNIWVKHTYKNKS